MKSVLLISNFLFQNGKGSKTVCEELAEKLTQQGARVITSSNKLQRIPRLVDMLCTIWTRRNEYDVAHVAVFSGPAFLWAEACCALLRHLKKPYALTLHGGNLPDFARRNSRRVRKLLRTTRIVLAPSEYLRQQMADYVDVGVVRVLPNALDLPRYPWRHRTHATPSLVWLRAFSHIYNPTLAPRVLRLVSEVFPDAQLTMIGPDKEDGSLQRTKEVACELGVESRICFAGGVAKTKVAEWLNRGDVFLNTTSIDNTPVSVLEAMACGLCVVSTKVGGIPYLLTHRRDSLLIEPDNAQQMASEILRLLITPELANTISRNARAKVENYDWSLILPEWLKLFRQLAETTK